jgi:MFS family permease
MKITRWFNMYSGLPRSIYVLFIVRIINAMGNFVYPFLTMYLTEKMGYSARQAGAFFMMSAICSGVGAIVGGKISDHFGRKKLLITFLGMTAISFVPCAFLTKSILIPIFIIIAGTFNGAAQPVQSAMVTDLTNKENRKSAFSLLYLGVNIGFAIGPILAGFMYRSHTRWIFFGNTISISISLILLILYVQESLPCKLEMEESKLDYGDEAAEAGNVLDALRKRPTLMMYLCTKFIIQFIYTSIGFALPLQMIRLFGNSQGPPKFGVLMSMNAIVVVAFTIPITKLTGHVKPIINVAIATVLYAVGFGMLGFVTPFYLFMLAAFVYTVGEILEATNSGVYIANHCPMSHRGRFNAFINIVSMAGTAVAPYIFGNIIDYYGFRVLWIICFILGILTSLFLLWLRTYEIKSINFNQLKHLKNI